MSYNSKLPMDDEYIASGPADIRENFRALKEDQIVDAGTLAGLSAGNAGGNIPKSNGIVNTNLNADLLDGQEASAFATASHTHSAATTSTAGFMSATDKTKIDGIATGAQVNQNAFGNVVVGTTTIQADSATDTLTLTAGTNISLTPDATNDAVTIAVLGTVPSAITATTCSGNAATAAKWAIPRTLSFTGDATGSMSVDGSAAANTELTLTSTGVTAGTYRSVTVDPQGRVTAGANPASEAINITGNAATATSCGGVGTAAIDISNTDLNLVTRPTGFYRGASMTNAPNGGWFYVVHIAHDLGSWIYQEAISYGSANTANLVYTRCLVNSVWSAWSQVAHISDIAASAMSTTGTFTVSKQFSNASYPQTIQIWSSSATSNAVPSAFPFTAEVVDSAGAFVTNNAGVSTNYRTIYSKVEDTIPAGTYALSSIIQALVDRSHRHVTHSAQGYTNCNCNCNCDCSSCFVGGTPILMSNGLWKDIQDVKIGDKVIGMNGNINTVYDTYKTTLGDNRSMYTFRNNSLRFTGEHYFWVKHNADNKECWGVHNYNEYLWEKEHPELIQNHMDVDKPIPYAITSDVKYATIEGWKEDLIAIDRNYSSDTPVYSLRVTGDHTHYANGIVVEGLSNTRDFDYDNLTWKGLNARD